MSEEATTKKVSEEAEVLAKTFDNFDKFGWNEFAQQLTDFIKTERHFVEGSLVISLNAEFGRGKTTFFEMWESMLNDDKELPDVVRLNAWQSDFINDPLLAIAFNVLEHLESSGESPEVIEKIKSGAGKLCRATASIGNDIVSKFTGVNLVKAGQAAESTRLISEEEMGEKIYSDYQERTKALEDIRDGLKEAFSKEGVSNLVVIVDELDRCRPDYSISYLETIKHIFDIPELTFVLGVDKGSLECAAKALFGQDLKFDEYYRKFVHRNISLPVPSSYASEVFCSELVRKYLQTNDSEIKRFSCGKVGRQDIQTIHELLHKFDLTPRQIHEFFRVLAHLLLCEEDKSETLYYGKQLATIFMVILSLSNKALYNRFGQNQVALSEFGDFLGNKGFLSSESYEDDWWYIALFLSFKTNSEPNVEELPTEMRRLGILPETQSQEEEQKAIEDLRNRLSNFSRGYGRSTGRNTTLFMDSYSRIEGLLQFARG